MSNSDGPIRVWMLKNHTATGVQSSIPYVSGVTKVKTYSASGLTTSGAGAATIQVQGSNNEGESWEEIDTITLTLSTDRVSDGFTSQDRYHRIRGYISAISGTGASVDLIESH